MAEVKPLTRRERAAATKRVIVEAATAEFTERGYHSTTVASIARRAGYATQTVYFVFHTKGELLTAAIDAAVLGGGAPPDKTQWWAEATSIADGPRSVELFVRGTAEILERAALLNQVAAAAMGTDPEVAEVLAHHERLREQGYSAFIGTLKKRGLLLPRTTNEEATDVLLTLAGPSVYLDLVHARGWGADRYMKWTCRTLSELLVRPD